MEPYSSPASSSLQRLPPLDYSVCCGPHGTYKHYPLPNRRHQCVARLLRSSGAWLNQCSRFLIPSNVITQPHVLHQAMSITEWAPRAHSTTRQAGNMFLDVWFQTEILEGGHISLLFLNFSSMRALHLQHPHTLSAHYCLSSKSCSEARQAPTLPAFVTFKLMIPQLTPNVCTPTRSSSLPKQPMHEASKHVHGSALVLKCAGPSA
jgi:hypothetical protein